MTPSARLQAVLDILTLIETTLRPADAITSHFFRARRYIGSKDRGAVSTVVYALLRHQGRLTWWLESKSAEVTPRQRLLAYLILVEQQPLEAINKLFDGKKYSVAALVDQEKELIQKLKGLTLDNQTMPEAYQVECPPWAEAHLKRRFRSRFRRELRAMLEPATLDLRINPLKTTREAALSALKDFGLDPIPTPLSTLGIRLLERPSLSTLPMLREGLIEIQDEGSQLVAALVDAEPGQRVVDFCAGAGGKTLAIAAQMNNKGRVTACDVLATRLKRSTERFRRAGLHNIEVKPLETEHDPWVKRHKLSFDRVLVDAPCSGTGTWRRNPDQRYRSLGPGIEKLLPLQLSILESASRLVKPGGRLIYATCSLLAAENEDQIGLFLEKNTDFVILDFSEVWKSKMSSPLPCDGPYLSLTPAQHHTDGFFAALLLRKPLSSN